MTKEEIESRIFLIQPITNHKFAGKKLSDHKNIFLEMLCGLDKDGILEKAEQVSGSIFIYKSNTKTKSI